MAHLTRGNRKLGPDVYHFDLPAGPEASCPGASTYCAAICYARKGHFTFGNVQAKYAANFAAVHDETLEASLTAELANLPADTVVRLHTSGDFVSASYAAMWRRIAEAFPHLTFYAYTRSWTIPNIRRVLETLRQLPNFTVWASHDPSMPAPPPDWPVARIVPTFADAPGEAHCPEQTGMRPNCQSCGLCFNRKLRPSARLAFKLH